MFNISFVVYCFYDILMYFFVILTYVFHFFFIYFMNANNFIIELKIEF